MTKPLDQLEGIVTALHECRKGNHWNLADLDVWLREHADDMMDLIFDAKNEQDALYPDQQMAFNYDHTHHIEKEAKAS